MGLHYALLLTDIRVHRHSVRALSKARAEGGEKLIQLGSDGLSGHGV